MLLKSNRWFAFLGIAVVLSLCTTPTFSQPLVKADRNTPIVQVVRMAAPAVVNVSTEKIVQRRSPFHHFSDEFFFDFFNLFPYQDYKQQSLGSGVLINDKGYVLTNEHNILKAASEIIITTADNRFFNADLLGSSARFDIAVLKIRDPDKDLKWVKMGDSSDIMIGETVIAIGNPFGLSHTVTTGIISAVNRSIRMDEDKIYRDFIQTDASINPGNSGGPLLNIQGSLIGINTAIMGKAEGIGFAIPINKAKRVVNSLLNYGEVHTAWVGIYVQDLTPQLIDYFNLKERWGVMVSLVVKDSPAAKAGIQNGDIILEIDGNRLLSAEDFYLITHDFIVGEQVKIKVFRGGEYKILTIKGEELPMQKAEQVAFSWLGVKVAENTRRTRAIYRLYSKIGVVIVDVKPGSKAAQVGLAPGDIIHQINETPIKNMEDFRKAIVKVGDLADVLMIIQRGDRLYYIKA